VPTEARDLSTFSSLDALIAAEKDSTILIAEVPKGQTGYTDPFVPLNGVQYYYWIQAESVLGGLSPKVAADRPTAVREARVSTFTVYPAFPTLAVLPICRAG
jgi:hypothetical protein